MGTSLFCGEKRRSILSGSLLLLVLGLSLVSEASAVDFAVGVAFPRGFYENALGLQSEFTTGLSFLPKYVAPVARLSLYGATRDKVSLVVGSGSLLLKATAPASASNVLGFAPYVAVGPSFNYLYSSADLEDFGAVSNSQSSTTLSVFAGIEFFPTSKVSIFGEARQTIPSEFTFDYVMVGLKFRGPKLPSIE